mgnify:CR=1 FL=1
MINAKLSENKGWALIDKVLYEKVIIGARFWGHGYNKKGVCKKYRFWIPWGKGSCVKCNFS